MSDWTEQQGLDATTASKHAAKGALDELRLQEFVGAGLTIAEIAGEVGRSKSTVRHWLRRYGLRTLNAVGRRPVEAGVAAKEAGLERVQMRCVHHGETEFVLEGRGYFRRCRSERVSAHRRKLKSILVAEAGGRCALCGYDRTPRALEFHHLDPIAKRFHVSADGVTLALDRLRAEASKCVLLCSNCHAEVEDGVAEVPLQFGDGESCV